MTDYFADETRLRQPLLWVVATRQSLDRWEAEIAEIVRLGLPREQPPGFRQLAGTARLGWGPKVALLGGVALCAGAWVPGAWLGARRPAPKSVLTAGDS